MYNLSYQNSTLSNYVEPDYSSVWWILLQTATCVLTMIQLYVLFNLLRYENITRRSEQEMHATKSLSQRRSSHTRRSSRNSQKVWLRRLIILASASALFKLVSNQIDLFYGTKSNDACQVLGYAAVSGYGGSLCFVYFGLWLRQASLQSLNALCHLPRKKIRLACSWALLVVMVVAFAVLFFLNFVTMALSASPYGCIFSDIGKVSQSARSSAGLVFTFVFQPAFAALLLYPLLKKMPSQRRKTIRSETAYKNAMRVYRLIKRCLITLLIITVSDIGTIIASFKLETSPVILLAMVYDLNAFIGIASLLFSFADWRKRLGFRTNRNDSNQPTSASSS